MMHDLAPIFNMRPEFIDSKFIYKSLRSLRYDVDLIYKISEFFSLEHKVFLIEETTGKKFVIKYYCTNMPYNRISFIASFIISLSLIKNNTIVPALLGSNKGVMKSVYDVEEAIHTYSNSYFLIQEFISGKSDYEINQKRARQLGVSIAEMHNTSSELTKPKEYCVFDLSQRFKVPSMYFLNNMPMSNDLNNKYHTLLNSLQNKIYLIINDFFKEESFIQCHGDCSPYNTIWASETPYFYDFDLTCYSHPVLDIWRFTYHMNNMAKKSFFEEYIKRSFINDIPNHIVYSLNFISRVRSLSRQASYINDKKARKIYPNLGDEKILLLEYRYLKEQAKEILL